MDNRPSPFAKHIIAIENRRKIREKIARMKTRMEKVASDPAEMRSWAEKTLLFYTGWDDFRLKAPDNPIDVFIDKDSFYDLADPSAIDWNEDTCEASAHPNHEKILLFCESYLLESGWTIAEEPKETSPPIMANTVLSTTTVDSDSLIMASIPSHTITFDDSVVSEFEASVTVDSNVIANSTPDGLRKLVREKLAFQLTDKIIESFDELAITKDQFSISKDQTEYRAKIRVLKKKICDS